MAVTVGVGQAPGHLEADMDPEATVAYLIGAAVAVTIVVGQATGHLEAIIRMTGIQDVWRSKNINCEAPSIKLRSKSINCETISIKQRARVD